MWIQISQNDHPNDLSDTSDADCNNTNTADDTRDNDDIDYGTRDTHDTDDTLFESLSASPFGWLPFELHVLIMTHAPSLTTLRAIFNTCRLWALQRDDDVLWEQLFNKVLPAFAPYKPPNQTWKWTCRCASVRLEGFPQPATGLGYIPSMWFPPNAQCCRYLGEFLDGVPHGVGIWLQIPNNNSLWVARAGDIRNGELNGNGAIYNANGTTYHGELQDNFPHGTGTMIWPDGSQYEGAFARGYPHGHGEYRLRDGLHYKGDMQQGRVHGTGTLFFSNGRYDGSFVHDKREGKGRLTWDNGNCYVGTFYDNCRTGHGVYTWKSGDRYEGEWVNDRRAGHGTSTGINGIVYTGEYMDDLRHGSGTLTWPNGDRYIGVWKRGGRWGKGTFICATSGETTAQHWHEAEFTQYSRCLPLKYSPTEQGELLCLNIAAAAVLDGGSVGPVVGPHFNTSTFGALH